jgi:hypothetical protein
MNHMAASVNSVKEKIESAFVDVQFPADNSILRPDSKDEEEIKDFKGRNWKTWKDIPKDVIDYNHSSLPFFSSSALIFLLPAYMMVGLDDPTTNTLLFTVLALMANQNHGGIEPTEYFLSWANKLTHDQKSSVVLFLEYVVKTDESNSEVAAKVLQSYWNDVTA